MSSVKAPIVIIAIFLWIGFVCAISFMEAWLKFQAPDVTLAIGLGIGRLVFGVLNKVEWVFAITVLITIIRERSSLFTGQHMFFLIPFFILIIQTFSLLPALAARAELHIQGQNVPPSNLHFFMLGGEAAKVICLSIFGIKQFKQ